MDRIRNTLRYIALSYKINFTGGARLLIWMVLLILPSVLEIINSRVYSGLIDSFAGLTAGTAVTSCFLWLTLVIAVRGAYSLLTKTKYIVFDRFARESDRKMSLYTIKRVSELEQISFDSSSRFSQIKDALKTELSLWSLNWQMIIILSSLITIVGSAAIISAYSFFIVLIAALSAVLIIIIGIRLSGLDVESQKKLSKDDHTVGYYDKLFSDSSYAKELKLFSAYEKFIDRWREAYVGRYKSSMGFERKKQRLVMLQGFIEVAAVAAASFFIARAAWIGRITIGDFYLYTANFSMLYAAFSEISDAIKDLLSLSENYNRFESFTESTSHGERKGEELSLPEKCNIRFDHVSFSYENESVLKDISFELKDGERIALIGRNGSGKSTLIKLLCGLYTPDSGEIYINDKPYSRYSKSELYKLFGVVYQDFNKFKLSVRENLSAQRPDAASDDAALFEVYKNSGLDTERLKNGLDTMLGREYDPDGMELSGGQWQRIAIARCEFGNRLCRVFDEPASALDSVAENKFITDNLLHGSKSVIIISHRLSIGKLADKVIYLDRGRIVEQGTHDELIQRDGEYAKMYKLQASLYQRGVDC